MKQNMLSEADRLYIALAHAKRRGEVVERALKEAIRILRWHGLTHYLLPERAPADLVCQIEDRPR